MNATQKINTIVVADDDSLLRRFISITLTGAGFQVIEAASGARAEELIRANRNELALAICDIRMPGYSGLDVAAGLSHEKAGPPVLLISGAVGSIAVQSILLKNPKAVLTKPFTAAELTERVHALTTGAERARPVHEARAGGPVETQRKPPHGQPTEDPRGGQKDSLTARP